MERPLLLPLVALMAGICAKTYLGFFFSPWLVIPAALALAFAFVSGRRLFFIFVIALLSLVWGSRVTPPSAAPPLAQDHIAHRISASPVNVTGVVCRRPQRKDRSTRLIIEAETVNGSRTTGRMMLTIKGEPPAVMTGDHLSFVTRLRSPRNFGIPGEYDFQRALALQGIFATGTLADGDAVVSLNEQPGFPLQRRIDELAEWLGRFIDKSVPAPESGVLNALLVGDRGSIPAELEDLYARTGVNHILSISGFHLGIVAVVIYQLLLLAARQSSRLLQYNIRWMLLLSTLPFLLAYLLVSGAAPATLRSALMISSCFLALFLERETDTLNSLSLAAFAILALTPAALFDLSFQLSFLALWGILVIAPLLLNWYRWERRGWFYRLLQFVAVSLAAILATLLPVAYSFHRVSLVGILSNFVAVPLLGYGAVVLGFLGLIFSPLAPVVALLLLKLAAQLVSWSDQAMVWIDRIPQLPRFSPTLPDVLLGVAFLALLTVVKCARSRLIAAVFLVAISTGMRYTGNGADVGSLKVLFFSVGQGDSTFMRFPDGSTMLVDGGGSLWDGGLDVGERLLVPALLSLGIDRIDRLVLTHPHPDHVKGLVPVARNFPVGEFWESGRHSASPAYRELTSLLSAKGVKTRVIDAATPPFSAGGALIEPLAPAQPVRGGDTDWEVNEESLVLRLTMGGFSLLLTGDAGFVSESRLVQRPHKLKSTVLKVAHHGSRYSTSVPFLNAVSPRLSVISAGYGNSFRLPAAETLADIRANGTDVHRTDLDGTLELRVNTATGDYKTRKYPPSGLTPIDYVP